MAYPTFFLLYFIGRESEELAEVEAKLVRVLFLSPFCSAHAQVGFYF